VILVEKNKSSWKCVNLDRDMAEIIRTMKLENVPYGMSIINYNFIFKPKTDSAAKYISAQDSIDAFATYAEYSKKLKEISANCAASENDPKCEDLEFKISDAAYKAENAINFKNKENFELLHKKWRENEMIGNEPLSPIPIFSKTIESHERYINENISSNKKSFVQYRLAYILEIVSRQDDALKLYMNIVRDDLNFKNISDVYVKISEYYKRKNDYKNAIIYYEKFDALSENRKGSKDQIEKMKIDEKNVRWEYVNLK